MFGTVFELAGDREFVGGIELLRFRVHPAGRRKICHAEELAEAFEPMPKTMRQPSCSSPGLAQVVKECLLCLLFLEVLEVLPFHGLGFLMKG